MPPSHPGLTAVTATGSSPSYRAPEGCFHIRHDFPDGAPALEELCSELEGRTGLDLTAEFNHFEPKRPLPWTDAQVSRSSGWPNYTQIAFVQVRGFAADVEIHRAEHTIGVEFLFGGVCFGATSKPSRSPSFVVTVARPSTRSTRSPPLWTELPWRQAPKVWLWFQALGQYALMLGSYTVLPIGLPVIIVMSAFRGR